MIGAFGSAVRIAALAVLALGALSAARQPAQVATGTHWARLSDFPVLKSLGYGFVVVTVSPSDRGDWSKTFDAAEAHGLQLIVGPHPAPYRYQDGVWSITADGQAFLRYAASRASLVKGVFVYNEPYWIHPLTHRENLCGAMSAAELRDLRSAIRRVWPEAKVYHDIGWPSAWAPGGVLHADSGCLQDRYADATGVADLVGIWFYPFERTGYNRAEGLDVLRREIAYVRSRMNAEPVVASQGFLCEGCGLVAWPTPEQMRDWHCATRELGPAAISWYPWRQESYTDYLANRSELWDATRPGACAVDHESRITSIGPAAVAGADASTQTPVAPGALVTLFGQALSAVTAAAPAGTAPRTLGSVTVSVNGVLAPLLYVSPTQINCQFPFEISGERAAVTVTAAGLKLPAVEVPLAPASPSIFTQLLNGSGPGSILRADGTLVSRGNPVEPLETMRVFATGLGAVRPAVESGTPAPAPPSFAAVAAPVRAFVDGRPADVVSAGLAPSFVGLYQVDVRVPPSLGMTYPSVTLEAGGVLSQTVTAGGIGLLDVLPAAVPAGKDAVLTLRGRNFSPDSLLEAGGQRFAGEVVFGDLDEFRVVIPAAVLRTPGLDLVLAAGTGRSFSRSNAVPLRVNAGAAAVKKPAMPGVAVPDGGRILTIAGPRPSWLLSGVTR